MSRKPTYRELEKRVKQLEKAESELERTQAALRERRKELNYFRGMAFLVEKPNVTSGEILQGVVDLIPPAWQYPGDTCARLVLDGNEYTTDNFRESASEIRAGLTVDGRKAGHISVYYLGEPTGGTPFLEEERELLDLIAERLGRIIERIRTREALQYSRTMLMRTERIASIGSWEWDIGDDKVRWSEELFRIFGLDPSRGAPSFAEHPNLYQPDDMERLRRAVERCVEDGTPYRLELRAVTAEGDIRHCVARGEAETDENGNIYRLVGSLQDITEHKRAEEALQQSEIHLRTLVRTIPDLVWLKDPEGVYLACNPRFESFFGKPESEIVGKTDYDFVDRTTADFFRVHDDLAIEQESPTRNEEHITFAEDGHTEILETIKTPMYDQDGELIGVLGIGRDITERKAVEEELRKKRGELERIFEILPIGLWFADKNGTLLKGNPAGVEIWGAEPHVPLSEYGVFKAWRLPSREPIQPEDWALAKTIRQGVTITDELLEIESFDGKRKTILNYTAPILDDKGDVDGAIVVNLDVSDREALERQLAQAQKMESIGRLAGGVAHDFNNMLSVIIGNAELVLNELDESSPLHPEITGIMNAAERSAELTRQLLAFARKQTVVPKVLNINDAIASMLGMLRRLIGENIELIWKPSQHPDHVRIDPAQVDQVMVNLLVNARDVIGHGGEGTIIIETNMADIDEEYCEYHVECEPGRYVTISVSDNGCGMDEETLEHVFEPFFTTKPKTEGTGLGLATVYGIARQNGGFINIYSEPNRGTTVRIYLPVHRPSATDAVGDGETETAGEPVHATILLVEDEPAILAMGEKMLMRLGFTVLSAASPGEAVRVAEEHPREIDMVITDVVMPEMNGRELTRRLLSLYPEMKCLYMSGYTANVIAHQGVLDEGVNFIQKPFTLKELNRKIRTMLDA